jgi:nitronate monooxygenase
VNVPVIAAGGIADGRGAAAAMVLGASAVQLGTAFLRCEEANVHDAHRAALAEADEASTVVTETITGRPARLIRNKLIDDLATPGVKPLAFPLQYAVTAPLAASGDREMTALYSGQAARLAQHTSAARLVEVLGEEMIRRLRALAP